jgi:hypothetical protein
MSAEGLNPKRVRKWLPLVVFLSWALVFIHGFHQILTVSDLIKNADPLAEAPSLETDPVDSLLQIFLVWSQKLIQAPRLVQAVLKPLEFDWILSIPLFIRLHSLLL